MIRGLIALRASREVSALQMTRGLIPLRTIREVIALHTIREVIAVPTIGDVIALIIGSVKVPLDGNSSSGGELGFGHRRSQDCLTHKVAEMCFQLQSTDNTIRAASLSRITMAAGKKPRQRLTDGPAKVLDSDAATGGEKGEPAAASEQQREDIGQPFPIVGIGASAGGLEAFSQLIGVMPADTGMAFVLVQHLDPTHASMLSEIVSKKTAIPVTEARDRMPVEPDHIYVISPGSNMSLRGGVLQLSPRKETAGQFRPIDYFFRSLAHEQGHKAIGVILSGGATDGTLGMKEVKGGGGITFAQDATAQHDSMPRSAIAAGWVDHVLPPNEIAREIARISRHPYMAPREPQPDAAGEQAMQKVLEVVRTATGVDFTNYKRNTLHRRITRRLVLRKLGGLKEYARVLQSTPAEVAALYQDILISVTSFFRNPEAFDALKTHVFPELL
ncbi:MAG: chemotaxis protein CheB, partial [Gemmatimonadaceae bacterium]